MPVPLPKEDIEAQQQMKTMPVDPRFQVTNQTAHCFSKYVDYHRCMVLLGSRNSECEVFKKHFTSICPNMWIEKWDEQRSEGTFPYDFPKRGLEEPAGE